MVSGPDRLSAAGYAEYYPVAPNVTIEGRGMNRRVDIVILGHALTATPTTLAGIHAETPVQTTVATPRSKQAATPLPTAALKPAAAKVAIGPSQR